MPIKVLVLPEGKVLEVGRDEITLKELLELLGVNDPEEVAVVVDRKLVENPGTIIRSGMNVKVIFQGVGG